MDLNIIWFLLFTILIIGYAILDGFDLGVGVLHIFTKDEASKRININAIGPIWDGNEVWLLTAGGALFAAFPIVYATVFSSFYLAFMLLLTALIFRAVSFEFRTKTESLKYKKYWDFAFSFGSLVPALLYGVAMGNIMQGIPIDKNGVFAGNLLTLLNPYAILIGILNVNLFVLHGAVFMTLKTEGELREWMKKWINGSWILFVILYLISTIASFFAAPFLFEGILSNALFWIFFILLLISLVYIPIAIKSQKYTLAFLSSSLMIACIISLIAISLFPMLVPSSTDLSYSLTIYNSSSSQLTLKTMLIIAIIGMPIVIAYTIYVYKIFKGKVVLTKDSY